MAEGKINQQIGMEGYECPTCRNEQIRPGQNYCQICGMPIKWLQKPAVANSAVIEPVSDNLDYLICGKNAVKEID